MKDDTGMKIIACATVAEELRQIGYMESDLVVLEFGLHIDPDRLRSALQDRIDAIEGQSDIVLGYGLCSNAVVGLASGRHRLVIPRVDDCIAIFLGSSDERIAKLAEEPGTYFLTKGWIEAGDGTLEEYRRLVEKYGEERARRVAKAMLANYTRLALINTGNYNIEQYRGFSRAAAEMFGLRYEEIPGSNRLLLKMLQRDWDSEFIVVPAGGKVTLESFLGRATSTRSKER